jgi:hypothetical protein
VVLSWTQSTDNVTPQSNIQYDIYVDGFFDHSVVGTGSTTAFSGMGISVFDIQAVDGSGNYSLVNSLDAQLSGKSLGVHSLSSFLPGKCFFSAGAR